MYFDEHAYCILFDQLPAEDLGVSKLPPSKVMSSGSGDPHAPTPSATNNTAAIAGGK